MPRACRVPVAPYVTRLLTHPQHRQPPSVRCFLRPFRLYILICNRQFHTFPFFLCKSRDERSCTTTVSKYYNNITLLLLPLLLVSLLLLLLSK